jgi:peptide deformylase
VTVSEDVLFAFQFSFNDRPVEDHIFLLCSNSKTFGNAKVIYRSPEKIKCTEEFNGEFKQVIRSKEITIKAIDIDVWKQIEYSTTNPKESCTIQHAIDILELKWV